MRKTLYVLGTLTIVFSFVMGFVAANEVSELALRLHLYDDEFNWGAALSWWIGGGISSILFFAFGMMIEYLEDIKRSMQVMQEALPRKEHETNQNRQSKPISSNTKASLDSLKDYTFRVTE